MVGADPGAELLGADPGAELELLGADPGAELGLLGAESGAESGAELLGADPGAGARDSEARGPMELSWTRPIFAEPICELPKSSVGTIVAVMRRPSSTA